MRRVQSTLTPPAAAREKEFTIELRSDAAPSPVPLKANSKVKFVP